ncbi:MAG: ABC transporter permease [Candidatus Competibacterales bacterium]|nr:ABC transporter permease [Candidatus Competibacterales bacterium]
MDFSIVLDNLDLYLDGLLTTAELVAAALAIGLALAVPLALAAIYGNPVTRGAVFCYTYFFRGTPLLVQMFMLYYGAGQFEAIQNSVLWPVLREAYWCALIAFTLNTAAYTTEILRGAIRATPRGEIEAAQACGMSTTLMLRRIVLPSAFRRALPAYGNEVIFMLHGSAIASVITIVDLTGAARIINSRYYSPYEAFITAALFYMALTFVIVALFRLLERRWFAHLRPRSE